MFQTGSEFWDIILAVGDNDWRIQFSNNPYNIIDEWQVQNTGHRSQVQFTALILLITIWDKQLAIKARCRFHGGHICVPKQ